MLSAFVYPGAGQFLQKRWTSGAIYSLLFTLFSVVLIFHVFKPIFHNLNTALNWAASQDSSQSFEAISVPDVLLSFLAMLIVYVLNIMDVRRASRPRARPPPLPPTP